MQSSNSTSSFYLHGNQLYPQVINAIDSVNRTKLQDLLYDFSISNTITYETDQRIKTHFSKIKNYIQQNFRNTDIYLFGSHVTGFANKGSDLDITVIFYNNRYVLNLNNNTQKNKLRMIEDFLERLAIYSELKGVYTARMPILKVKIKDELYISVDISVSNLNAVDNNEIIKAYSDFNPCLSILGKLLKNVVKLFDIGTAYQGTLSPFGYTIMLIHFLQKKSILPILPERAKYLSNKRPRPSYYSCEMWYQPNKGKIDEAWAKCAPGTSIADLWIEFFKYYTMDFDIKNEVVSIRQSTPLLKSTKYWNFSLLAIEDPTDADNDVGGNIHSDGFSKIFNSFTQVLLAKGDINELSEKVRDGRLTVTQSAHKRFKHMIR